MECIGLRHYNSEEKRMNKKKDRALRESGAKGVEEADRTISTHCLGGSDLIYLASILLILLLVGGATSSSSKNVSIDGGGLHSPPLDCT